MNEYNDRFGCSLANHYVCLLPLIMLLQKNFHSCPCEKC